MNILRYIICIFLHTFIIKNKIATDIIAYMATERVCASCMW